MGLVLLFSFPEISRPPRKNRHRSFVPNARLRKSEHAESIAAGIARFDCEADQISGGLDSPRFIAMNLFV
jgi:hypothetical protein